MKLITRFLRKSVLSLLLITSITNYSIAQTTLVAGDIAFTGYIGHGTGPTTTDEFSFVLLKNITSGTVINFTENGWLSTNVFRTGESTITWTSNSTLVAGQEITIVGTTPSLASGAGTAGTVTGSAFALSANGDQILAYQGTTAAPTFITAIHMNVYDAVNNPPDPSTTTAAAWDGIANTSNSSALPTGLTTGVNAIWIGTQSNISTEKDNARFVCAGDLSSVTSIKALIFDQTKWTTSDNEPVGFVLPTGCSYIAAVPAPSFTLQPISSSICTGANTSFTIVAIGASAYQWQVDNGGGFVNITNDATYNGATTTTLTITATPFSLNGYLFRCVALNGSGSTNSNNATLTVTVLPVNPTLLAKTPATTTVADGTPVSATFNAGSGGTGCTDDYRYTTNGGLSYLPYTPGSNISTTGLAAAGGTVTIEGRRATCASTCQGTYAALASWIVTPLPAGATTLNAGDIAFSGYTSSTANSDFSFVLLKNIGPGTVINFTDNGWLSTNVFRTGETTVTWTSNAAYAAGTEIKMSGTTATLTSGSSAGTVTGTALSLATTGDQILAYRGSAASPTFISAIHMNVYSTTNSDPVNTTAAVWDATVNSTNASALPTGLTTGVNAIWIGIQGDINSEFDNAQYGTCSNPATFGPIATLRAALNNPTNWTKDNNVIPSFVLPTGCSYLGIGSAPAITTQPIVSSICAGTNTSFTIVATGATTYQWQVDNGGGFVNLIADATYSNVTTPVLNITAATVSITGYLYRCIATNGSGSTNSNSAALTVTILPVNPTLLTKTPSTITVADGTSVNATFTAGSGGTGCVEDYRYTIDGGTTYLTYIPGSNIITTGLAAASGTVSIEGRRANCTSSCQGTYTVLASWIITPIPVAASTLNAGDIAFSGYNSNTGDDFSFVLLKNIGPGTVVNFTNNGWLSTNVFRTGEETVTWTAPAGGLSAGTEIRIAALVATKSGGGAAGTVTGTALTLGVNGDQIIAYRGTAATPTFITAIHTNVYTVANGDPVTTTAAAWDGTANTTNASALPTGLTTGVNAIWIGTQGDINSEFDNAKYGTCANPATLGSIVTLRAALNNQTNWSRNNTPPGFNLPTGCNYLSILAPAINVTGTPLSAFTSCSGTASTEQNFSTSGSNLTTNLTITAPTGFEISITSGSGFGSSITLTQTGGTVSNTTIYVRLAASATGTPSGNISLVSAGATTFNVAVTGTVNTIPTTPTITAGGPTTFCTGGSVVLTSSSATGNAWSTGETTASITVITGGTYTVTITSSGCTSTTSAGTTVTVNPLPATPTITAGGPTTFCTGGSVVLTSSSAIGNTWSTGETTASITVITGGTYTVTVTSSGCTSAASAGTTITINPLPSTANAGPDLNACINPASATMAANVPAVGIGAWSQVPGGPATAIIFTTGSATTNIGGLTIAGVYTFVWTISSGICPPSRDTMTITVNTNPAPFTLTGGGTFCPGTTTLTGPVDPNYTYTWQKSLTGIANPNSFTSFVGTANTQDVTSSGNYRLIVTNPLGCSTSDTIPVSMADFVFNGSLGAGDAQQTGRLNRFASVSTCAAPKACPGTFTTTGARFYDSYTITNPRNVPVCATIGLSSGCGTSLFNVAYLGSFNPTALCTNYLADPGSSFPGTGFMEVTIPANATIVVVVHELNIGTGCTNYQLTVELPRETGVTVNPSTPVCSGTAVNLTAPIASSYLWNPGGNTTQVITVSPITTSKYYVTLGYGNVGCTTVDSAEVVVNQLPTTALAGNDTATCGLIINNLAANTPVIGTGTWTQVAGPGTISFGNTNVPNSSATATAIGVYTLRWTIATSGACPNSSQDDVLVNFVASPSIANAGTNKTACVIPGSAAMTATTPVIGTGVWTQVSGPSTAVIVNPTSPTTNITNLAGIGIYTFRWTVTNTPCPASFDDVDVVVNGNPVPFILAGGGTFCPGATTLTGPANPNYTYAWEHSLSGISNPNSFTAFGGNAQTQSVTSSSNYRLIVTNQFGCTASDTASVSMADYVYNGSLATGDLQQTGRINRFGVVSTCAAPKACPGTFTTTGARLYDAYTIINPRNVPVCATIGIASGCGVNMFSLAYSGSFDPTAVCTNYLADPGSSFPNAGYYEATIPANGSIVVVVHEVNTGTGCSNYQLTVDVPRDGAPIVINPPSVTCASTATFTAPVANSYLWTPGGATTRSFTTPPLFVDTKYIVTLGYGNNGCLRLDSATVTVTSLPPTISCPANITQNNSTGQCGRVVTYTTASSGLPAPTLSYAFTGATTASGIGNGSGSFFNVGTTNITVTATNACGSVNCSFTVTIIDNQPPNVTTGTISSCYPTVAAAQVAALAATSATDNCPGILTETASTVGTCSAVITVRTTDVAGNFTDVTYNTRIDNTAPTVTVGTIASCYPTVAAAEAAALAATSATDNCPGGLTEVASTIGTCSAVVTVTTTDGCGNATAITYNTRIDNTPPTITCPSAITVCGNTNVPVVNIATVTNVTDNCTGIITVTHQGDFVNSFSTTAPYTITRTYRATDGCGNFTDCTQLITVNPIVIVNTVANQVVCNVSPVSAVIFGTTATGGTTTYSWTNNTTSIGLAASGTGNIATFSGINTGTTPVTATITVTPTFTNNSVSCVGIASTFTITINPTVIVNAVSNQAVCNGSPVSAITFGTTATGGTTTYAWTNNTASIGLAASGTGNIANFNGINTGTAPVTATITVTPTFTNGAVSCVGTASTFTITVNPTVIVNAVANQVVCNGSPVSAITFGTTATGGTTTYAWTNNATSIGLSASGTGNIISFNGINTGTAPVTATITVTPTFTNGAVSCVGTARTFTITVNPIPTVNAVTSIAFCNAVASTPINFSGTVTGTVYSWTNSNTLIGLGASGIGNFPSFVPTNSGTTPITATITVTPSFTNGGVTCTGTSTSFVITINPTTRIATNPTNQTICFGSNASFVVTATGVALTYQWQLNPGSGFTNIVGATSPTLNLLLPPNGLNFTGNRYRCVVTGTCGADTSLSALLTINPTPNVTIAASPLTTLKPFQTTNLAANAIPAGGTYAWYYNDVLVPSATAPSFGPIGIDKLGDYKFVYTDLNGCVASSFIQKISGEASQNLWVYPNPNTGQFKIRFFNQNKEQVTVSIYNSIGKRIYKVILTTGTTYSAADINIRNQPSGMYVLEVTNSNNIVLAYKRIIIGR
jgi:hypothetical protein